MNKKEIEILKGKAGLPFITPVFVDTWKEHAKECDIDAIIDTLIDLAWEQGRIAGLMERELLKKNIGSLKEANEAIKDKIPDMYDYPNSVEKLRQLQSQSDAVEFKWIDVKESIPTERCLLLTASKMVVIGDRYKDIWRIDGNVHWSGSELVSDYGDNEITHWARLPKV